MAANGDRFDLDERGAAPLQLAAEANSAAHHAVDELREFRREQAERNRSLDEKIDRLATSMAELRGAGKLAAWLIGSIALVEPAIHLARKLLGVH